MRQLPGTFKLKKAAMRLRLTQSHLEAEHLRHKTLIRALFKKEDHLARQQTEI